MHITSSVFINDDETGLHYDFEKWLERLAPQKPYEQYRHNGIENNADAHLKRQIMGREVVIAVTKGALILERGNKSFTASLTDSGKSVFW